MPPRTASLQTDGALASAVSTWFQRAARPLPWRVRPRGGRYRRDPYHALVAETMLQQTQVSRVVERYARFVERFPTVRRLAAADLDEVLALWTGLGYYRRARSLHAAARLIVERFGGRVPREVERLRELPGVGRYTAGAIASIAFDEAAPIVDGNVARVLLRVHGRDAAADDRAAQGWLWERAAALAASAKSPGLFNEGLMELGATVCLPAPATARCEGCPVARWCVARREGLQGEIPRPKQAATRTDIFCATLLVEREDGAVLLEQRPERGMWAGLWQAPTVERRDRMPAHSELARAIGIGTRAFSKTDEFEFHATHRRLRFCVHRTHVPDPTRTRRGQFVTLERALGLALSSPQRRMLMRLCATGPAPELALGGSLRRPQAI